MRVFVHIFSSVSKFGCYLMQVSFMVAIGLNDYIEKKKCPGNLIETHVTMIHQPSNRNDFPFFDSHNVLLIWNGIGLHVVSLIL